MSHPEPLHRVWCDRRHVEVGSPVCSAMVGRVEVIDVMLFANGEDGTDVALVGADSTPLLAWPGHLMNRLVRLLEEATQIALSTWPPLVEPPLLDELVERTVIGPATDEYTERYEGDRPRRRITDDDDDGADQ